MSSVNYSDIKSVHIIPQALETGTERFLSFLGGWIAVAWRALIVWAFFALFFPALGITWLLVLCALIAIANAFPINSQAWIALVKRAANKK